jgi:hypothetical protein
MRAKNSPKQPNKNKRYVVSFETSKLGIEILNASSKVTGKSISKLVSECVLSQMPAVLDQNQQQQLEARRVVNELLRRHKDKP